MIKIFLIWAPKVEALLLCYYSNKVQCNITYQPWNSRQEFAVNPCQCSQVCRLFIFHIPDTIQSGTKLDRTIIRPMYYSQVEKLAIILTTIYVKTNYINKNSINLSWTLKWLMCIFKNPRSPKIVIKYFLKIKTILTT